MNFSAQITHPLCHLSVTAWLFNNTMLCQHLSNPMGSIESPKFKKMILFFFSAHRSMWVVPNAFIANMSLADLMLASLNCSFNFVTMRDRKWVFGSTYCTFNNFMAIVTVAASVLNLTAMSLDRWIIQGKQQQQTANNSVNEKKRTGIKNFRNDFECQISEYWKKGNILGRFGRQMTNIPFYSINIHLFSIFTYTWFGTKSSKQTFIFTN